MVIMNIDNFLTNILPPQHSQSPESFQKKRWVILKNGLKYEDNPKSREKQKIEKVLRVMEKKLSEFEPEIKNKHIQDLIKLKIVVTKKVQNYNKNHNGFIGSIYKFFSRLFYGDVNKLSSRLTDKIDSIIKNTSVLFPSSPQEPNPSDAPVSNDVALKNRVRNPSSNTQTTKETNSSISILLPAQTSPKPNQTNAAVVLNSSLFRDATQGGLIQAGNSTVNPSVSNIPSFIILLQNERGEKGALLAKFKEKKRELIQGGMKFETIQELKKMKKEARNLLRNGECSAAVKKSLENIIKQYDKLVKEVKVLTTLQEISRELRKPPPPQKNWYIVKIAKLAPKISDQPALVPTGILLRHNIAPLAGEVFFGISQAGANQLRLSGMRFAGLNVCVGYGSSKGFIFNPNIELDAILKTENLKYIFSIPRMHVAVLRLLLTGSKKESYPEIINHILKLKKELTQLNTSINPRWKSEGALIGESTNIPVEQFKTASLENIPKKDLMIGQIVAIERSDSSFLKYGMIHEKYDDGSYNVIVEKNGTTKGLSRRYYLPDDALELSVGKPPLSEDQISIYEGYLKTDSEKLDDLIKLFETVAPVVHSKEEKALIEKPFPIIWGSVSLACPHFRGGVTGEVVFEGKPVLGTDLQYIFTPSENVNNLQPQLSKYGVKVFSFEAAYYILGHDKQKHYAHIYDHEIAMAGG
jgi:hypothetical protein